MVKAFVKNGVKTSVAGSLNKVVLNKIVQRVFQSLEKNKSKNKNDFPFSYSVDYVFFNKKNSFLVENQFSERNAKK